MVHVKLPEDMFEELEAHAKSRHISRHQALREAVAMWNEAQRTIPERAVKNDQDGEVLLPGSGTRVAKIEIENT